MSKTRINISTDKDLSDFIKLFAIENRTTVAEIINQYFLSIKRRVEKEAVEDIFANPVFHQAMENVHLKLRNGSAKWHTYDEVFGK